ncbi:MAG: Crp/Fnr family transcriptional regulator [Eubacteriales bacterium]
MLDKMRHFFLFAGLPEDSIRTIMQSYPYEQRTYPTGADVFTPHSFARALGFLLTGHVMIYRDGADGRVLLNIVKAGECFGAASLFTTDAPYPTIITAGREATVLFFPQESVSRICREYPSCASNYMAFLSDRIRFLNDRIDSFSRKNIESRVAKYLAAHLEPNGRVAIPLTMKQLASSLAISRASLYRTLDALVAEGILTNNGGTLTVTNQNKLERLYLS